MTTATHSGDMPRNLERKLDERYHLVCIHSQPLVFYGRKDVYDVERLDFDRERGQLMNTLRESGRALTVRTEVATAENLRTMLTLGCRVLHYTGHGMKGCLVFENGFGSCHFLEANELRRLFQTQGRGPQRVRMVFVAACHSEAAAQAFVDAGVEHVVAVKVGARIADKSAMTFMNQFYLALLVGRSVREAFELGRSAVSISPDAATQRDEENFLLLPRGASHDARIFDLPQGNLVDSTVPAPPSNLAPTPGSFMGRNYPMQVAIEHLLRRSAGAARLVTLTGPEGIGKSACAIGVANYLNRRRAFEDGTVYCDVAALAKRAREADGSPDKSGPSGERGAGPGARARLLAAAMLGAVARADAAPCEGAETAADAIGRRRVLFVLDGVAADGPPVRPDDADAKKEKNKEVKDVIIRALSPMLSRFGRKAAASPWASVVCTAITSLLQRCPNVKVLATSEEPLSGVRTVVERVVPIPPLRTDTTAKLLLALAGPQPAGRPLDVGSVKKHRIMLLIKNHPRKAWEAGRLLQSQSLDTAAEALQRQQVRRHRPSDSKLQALLSSFIVCGPPAPRVPKSVSDFVAVDPTHVDAGPPSAPITPKDTTYSFDFDSTPAGTRAPPTSSPPTTGQEITEQPAGATGGAEAGGDAKAAPSTAAVPGARRASGCRSNAAYGSHRVFVTGLRGSNATLNGVYVCAGLQGEVCEVGGEGDGAPRGERDLMSPVYRQESGPGGRRSVRGGMLWQHGFGWCLGPKSVVGTAVCTAVVVDGRDVPWSGRLPWFVHVDEKMVEAPRVRVTPDFPVRVIGYGGKEWGDLIGGTYELTTSPLPKATNPRALDAALPRVYVRQAPLEMPAGGASRGNRCPSSPARVDSGARADSKAAATAGAADPPHKRDIYLWGSGERGWALGDGSALASNGQVGTGYSRPLVSCVSPAAVPWQAQARDWRGTSTSGAGRVTAVPLCGALVLGGPENVAGRYAVCEEIIMLQNQTKFGGRPVYQRVDASGDRQNLYMWAAGESGGWHIGPHRDLGSVKGIASSKSSPLYPWLGAGWHRDRDMAVLPLTGYVGHASVNQRGVPVPASLRVAMPLASKSMRSRSR